MKTPAEDGFYMPAEWEKHGGTWLQWPHDDLYPGHQMRLEGFWLALTGVLHRHEMVYIAVQDERRAEHVQHLLQYYGFDMDNIDLYLIATDDVWARDNGPVFVVDGKGNLAATAWNFNGWGKRYAYEVDRTVPRRIAELLDVPLYEAPITLEGGAIEVNGQGTLMATRSSIINDNRNPDISQGEIEAVMKAYLGLEKIIWLSGAPREFCDRVGSDTDMHIDGYARFVGEATVLYSWTEDRANPYYPYLKQHRQDLVEATTASGNHLTTIALPLPESLLYSTVDVATRPPFSSKLTVAEYANFYVANEVILVPAYGDANDARARGIIAEHYPDREIIGLPVQLVAELGGMMHCVTQQQPATRV
jgi:agmatine deiminase